MSWIDRRISLEKQEALREVCESYINKYPDLSSPCVAKKMILDGFRELGESSLKSLLKKFQNQLLLQEGGGNPYKQFLIERGIAEHQVRKVKHWQSMTGEARFSVDMDPQSLDYATVRDETIAAMDEHSPKYPKIKRKKVKEGHLLVIDPADVHVGKLALPSEVGGEYNHDIAIQRVHDGVQGILSKALPWNIDRILLVIGNDILHVDNKNNTTTRGTAQDVSTMWHEAFKLARQLYVEVIESLIPIAPVDVTFNPSNHDNMSGFMLADSINSWFRRCKDVSFDVTINPRKYYKYHGNMIATDHGDGCKEKDVPLLMATEQPVMWSETKYRYSYRHHVHHKSGSKGHGQTKDYSGVTVEYLRSPSESDAWHHFAGYTGGVKAIEGFIHSKEKGQVCRLTHLF